jgi:hypothetical protein
VTSTNLRTEFLLQFWKQREDSAILLASNRPQQERPDKERQKGKRKTKGKDKQGKTKNKWAYRKLPTYKTWSKIILKMQKAEIPNRNFSLRSNPLVLFRRTFKGYVAFRKTIRLTIWKTKNFLQLQSLKNL